MEIVTIAAVGHTSGLFIVLFSIFLLRERVGKWLWSALLLGLQALY